MLSVLYVLSDYIISNIYTEKGMETLEYYSCASEESRLYFFVRTGGVRCI